MEFEILDIKEIDHRKWYLCKGNLLKYLNSLKENFYEYAIQRRIVKNQYLDSIYKTIKIGDPLPVITLTVKDPELLIEAGNMANVDMRKVEILDGLQRTFRLWSYKIVSEMYRQSEEKDVTEFAKKLKVENDIFFESGVLSTGLIRSLIKSDEINQIEQVFDKFDVYFIIWAGLKEDEIINKMLVLNAGQKSVSKTHQFELLFLNFYNDIRSKNGKIKLYREKEKNAGDIKKGAREIGEFMFSSIIVSLQSFVEMKPLRVSTEDLIEDGTDKELQSNFYEIVFSEEFLNFFLSELLKVDAAICEKHIEKGKEWFVKDTTLSGVFAGVGKHIGINETWDKKQLIEESQGAFDLLRLKIQAIGFDLGGFNEEYSKFLSSSVNIGNYIRKVVMNYTEKLLDGEEVEWKKIFDEQKPRR